MSTAEDRLWFDLNLALMEDEALVVLAQECEFGPARDELIVRYGSQSDRLVRWLAQGQGICHSDVDDARQSAVFALIEAISKYDTGQIGKHNGCSFRSFAYRVLMARFKDFAKHHWRVEGRYDRSMNCSELDFPEVSGGTPDDPAAIAEVHESMNRLKETLGQLDGEDTQLWRLMAAGHSLHEIAEQLSSSYDAVKRRRRKLIEQLKLRLNPNGDSVEFSAEMNLG